MDAVFDALSRALPTLVAWSTVLQAVVVIGAIGFTVRQLWQGTRARELSSLQDVFAGMHSGDAYALRDRVLMLDSDVESWSKKEWRMAREVADRAQRVGFFARHHFVRKRLVLEMYSLLLLNLWRVLEPYVIRERERMKTPNYSRDFKWLADEALAYRTRNKLPVDGRVSTGRDFPNSST